MSGILEASPLPFTRGLNEDERRQDPWGGGTPENAGFLPLLRREEQGELAMEDA